MLATRTLLRRTLALVVVFLAACGGSSSESDGPVPTASISIAASVPVNAVVSLNGTGSSTATGAPLYNWVMTSKPVGSAATVSNTAISAPTFTPDLVGTYAFSLTVSDGKRSTTVTGSSTASVVAPPSITANIVEPLSGSVQLNLSADPGAATVTTWTVDGVALGTGLPLTWDTTTVANGGRVVAASLLYAGAYTVNLSRTFQVTQSPVVLSNSAISAASGQITAIVSAASVNGIVSVSATLDGVGIGSLAVPNACTDSTGVACATTGLNGFSFSGAVVAGSHVVIITATDGIGNTLGIQLGLVST